MTEPAADEIITWLESDDGRLWELPNPREDSFGVWFDQVSGVSGHEMDGSRGGRRNW
jgi:hypothetical protein